MNWEKFTASYLIQRSFFHWQVQSSGTGKTFRCVRDSHQPGSDKGWVLKSRQIIGSSFSCGCIFQASEDHIIWSLCSITVLFALQIIVKISLYGGKAYRNRIFWRKDPKPFLTKESTQLTIWILKATLGGCRRHIVLQLQIICALLA